MINVGISKRTGVDEMTDYTEVKVSELDGVALDYAVAKAIGLVATGERIINGPILVGDALEGLQRKFAPSNNWTDCGFIIEEHLIGFGLFGDWVATVECRNSGVILATGSGKTHQIAACRAVATLAFGKSVDIPTELLE